MITNKAAAVCVLRILEEYSDDRHILSTREMSEHLKSSYDLALDRRTIYAAVETLNELGYDISDYGDNGKGYYLRERMLDSTQVRLLIDAVNSFEYISKRQSEELADRLKSMLSVNDRRRLTYANIIRQDKKSPNPQVFLNIEILDEAITARKKVRFTYMDYGFDKKLHPRRAEKYVASPYSMICENERYYLVLISEGHSDVSFYRIDMMQDIEILDEKIDLGKREAGLDSAKRVVYAHTGEPQIIRIRGDRTALRYVIEEFGKDIVIQQDGPDHFIAIFSAAPDGMVYWALQYMQHVEVLAPDHLRERIKDAIRKNVYLKTAEDQASAAGPQNSESPSGERR